MISATLQRDGCCSTFLASAFQFSNGRLNQRVGVEVIDDVLFGLAFVVDEPF